MSRDKACAKCHFAGHQCSFTKTPVKPRRGGRRNAAAASLSNEGAVPKRVKLEVYVEVRRMVDILAEESTRGASKPPPRPAVTSGSKIKPAGTSKGKGREIDEPPAKEEEKETDEPPAIGTKAWAISTAKEMEDLSNEMMLKCSKMSSLADDLKRWALAQK
jgi:hypothetical protein